MEDKFEIVFNYIDDGSDDTARPVLFVERSVFHDGDLVYSDHLEERKYRNQTDPYFIRLT